MTDQESGGVSLLHPRTIAFFRHFAGAYPTGTILMIALLVMSGLLEGVSVITLVPLLEVSRECAAAGQRLRSAG